MKHPLSLQRATRNYMIKILKKIFHWPSELNGLVRRRRFYMQPDLQSLSRPSLFTSDATKFFKIS